MLTLEALHSLLCGRSELPIRIARQISERLQPFLQRFDFIALSACPQHRRRSRQRRVNRHLHDIAEVRHRRRCTLLLNLHFAVKLNFPNSKHDDGDCQHNDSSQFDHLLAGHFLPAIPVHLAHLS